MTGWVALGRAGDRVRALQVSGGAVTGTGEGADEAEALAGIGGAPGTVIRIGEGRPDALPAPVLPQGGRALPGFTQSDPPDVIGGWVRLWIAGFLAGNTNWDGVICAREGGVSHWVHVSAQEAVSSQSFLSLRIAETLDGAAEPEIQAVADSLSRPERLAAHLRSAQVSGDGGAITGHLIGAELAAARVYWLGQQVAVLDASSSPHAAALAQQGVPCECRDPDMLVGPGLAALGRALGLED
ncbi:2-dehydro-3-deoxygalactonokinase [Roseovarius salis]|uniref:2-dehydro-3-deoxygalactonokinase n=1 Tax=Roseovarius salis TaxID=3376063 RepID=UPI0037C5FF89